MHTRRMNIMLQCSQMGGGTKALFRLAALTRVPCSGTKMDVVETRQCPELIMFIDN